MCLIHAFGGAFTKQPEELSSRLSAKASDLVKRAFDDIDSAKLAGLQRNARALNLVKSCDA